MDETLDGESQSMYVGMRLWQEGSKALQKSDQNLEQDGEPSQ
jgi:hypothetical protein